MSICGNHTSASAASLYYQNRYAAFEECSSPCHAMDLVTINKYTVASPNTSSLTIMFPRHVEVTREAFVKTEVSLGRGMSQEAAEKKPISKS